MNRDRSQNRQIKHSFLKGEFHGRNVVVLLQRGRGKYPDGCLKARWRGEAWRAFFPFPGSFDRADWQTVLEAMDILAGSLERQWLRVYMRSKMIKHNKDLFECVGDPMTRLEKLHIY